jgi:hypothetical protein
VLCSELLVLVLVLVLVLLLLLLLDAAAAGCCLQSVARFIEWSSLRCLICVAAVATVAGWGRGIAHKSGEVCTMLPSSCQQEDQRCDT